MPVPCHLIAGPLGAGKTTAIADYIKRHAHHQRVAVLVNDIGPFTLDAVALADAPDTRVLTVPGGCICCTLVGTLANDIAKLLAAGDIDRLIIEPSGLAAAPLVVDLLRSSAEKLNIDIRPVIVLLSAARFNEEAFRLMPYFQVFADAADVLVINRCDAVTAERVEYITAWARRLDPPKLRIIATQFGKLPDDVFELTAAAAMTPAAPYALSPQALPGHDAHPGMLTLPAARVFDADALRARLQHLAAAGVAGSPVLRLKAIFHTTAGWQSLQIADGLVSIGKTSYRRDNRVEWITGGAVVEETAMLAALSDE